MISLVVAAKPSRTGRLRASKTPTPLRPKPWTRLPDAILKRTSSLTTFVPRVDERIVSELKDTSRIGKRGEWLLLSQGLCIVGVVFPPHELEFLVTATGTAAILGLLLSSIGLGLATSSPTRLGLSLLLNAILHLKIDREEKALIELYGDEYIRYQAETPRLYPVVPVLTTVLRAAAAQAVELADPEK